MIKVVFDRLTPLTSSAADNELPLKGPLGQMTRQSLDICELIAVLCLGDETAARAEGKNLGFTMIHKWRVSAGVEIMLPMMASSFHSVFGML